ncbi:hypothetical protein PAHAL_7G144400 [Panicum hallii]|jgi:hypothetical protein|uniref:Uncharacterized protein n=1 Tax=Panicum hallii TaxID=206008 RepID=A0A2T8ICB9_9POAL|nr:hypothetical protein PAHAL_7G144400 [Panicum hallii]
MALSRAALSPSSALCLCLSPSPPLSAGRRTGAPARLIQVRYPSPAWVDADVVFGAVVAGATDASSAPAAAFFSLALLLRLFWLCALDAPADAGYLFFRDLRAGIERALGECPPALGAFLRAVGPDVEERFMRSLGYMLAKWCLLREMQAAGSAATKPAPQQEPGGAASGGCRAAVTRSPPRACRTPPRRTGSGSSEATRPCWRCRASRAPRPRPSRRRRTRCLRSRHCAMAWSTSSSRLWRSWRTQCGCATGGSSPSPCALTTSGCASRGSRSRTTTRAAWAPTPPPPKTPPAPTSWTTSAISRPASRSGSAHCEGQTRERGTTIERRGPIQLKG